MKPIIIKNGYNIQNLWDYLIRYYKNDYIKANQEFKRMLKDESSYNIGNRSKRNNYE